MPPIIKVEKISKQYQVGARDAGYSTLRETLVSTARAPLKMFRNGGREDQRFWALRDVSFEVNPGEVLGIIGRNGAGKSTLLKILSRITEPTTGRIELYGRMGSLLEVGTGFHPELTGRENIYLNGSILGMARNEVESKFDEIVDFAEIGKFLDTPVKRYSSGMYLRLAFAVAAHLEPEILVIDEVLAVGDAAFQKKCLNKMQDVSRRGRTVLFVSHNTAAVQTLCTRAILLNEGMIVAIGNVQQVVLEYLREGMHQAGERTWPDRSQAPGDTVVRLRAVRARNTEGQVQSEFTLTEQFSIEVEFWVLHDYQLDVALYIYNEAGSLLFVTGDFQDPHWHGKFRPVGIHRSICSIPANLLNEGSITILVGISTNPNIARVIERDAITLRLIDDFDHGGARGNYTREWPGGAVRPRMEWSFGFEPHQIYDDVS
jgi:lipopolysaccharide transport system ATP-binding protein